MRWLKYKLRCPENATITKHSLADWPKEEEIWNKKKTRQTPYRNYRRTKKNSNRGTAVEWLVKHYLGRGAGLKLALLARNLGLNSDAASDYAFGLYKVPLPHHCYKHSETIQWKTYNHRHKYETKQRTEWFKARIQEAHEQSQGGSDHRHWQTCSNSPNMY